MNIAYDEVEARNFVKLKLLSLGLTLGGIVFVIVTFGLVAIVPAIIEALPLGIVGTVLANIATWVLLLAVFAGSLAVLYRVAPDRDPRFSWVSLGAVIVTVIWAAVSVGFAVCVDNFGSYDKTYGAIAGVIVLMLWLYLTCYLVLLGAEINRGRAPDRARHDHRRAPADGRPRRRWPTRCPRTRSPRRPTATRRGRPPSARVTRRTAGGAPRPSAGDHGRRRRPRRLRHPGRRVQQRQRDPGPQCGRERAAGDLADRGAGDVEHGHAGTRDAPAGGLQAPQQAARAGLLLGSEALRPQNSGFFQPTAHPALACTGVMSRDSSWPCSG